LTNCNNAIVTDNVFHQPNDSRTNVDLQDGSAGIVVSDNIFNSFNSTAIDTGPNTNKITVTDNRFADRVDTVINNGANQLAFDSAEFRGAGLSRTSSQDISPETWTDVEWEEAEYDPTNLWPGEDEVVIPENIGIQRVKLSASVGWQDNAPSERFVEFTKNGDSSFFGNDRAHQTVRGGSRSPEGGIQQNVESAVVPVQGGDVLQVRVKQTSNKTLALDPDKMWFGVTVVEG